MKVTITDSLLVNAWNNGRYNYRYQGVNRSQFRAHLSGRTIKTLVKQAKAAGIEVIDLTEGKVFSK